MLKKWTLKNVILLVLIAIICGVIFWATDFIYDWLSVVLTPIGLGPLANESMFGLWIVAGPIAAYIFRTFGAAFLGELFSAIVEMLLGGQFGASAVISGIVQGIGSELGFALTGYKNFRHLGLILSVITTTVISFLWEALKNGYFNYHVSLIIIMIITRLISIFIFGYIIPILIGKLLEKSHALRSIR